MFKIKSFQHRILLALVGIGLVPAFLILLVGTFTVWWGVEIIGSAGPWSSLAESGQDLLDAVGQAQVADSAVVQASQTHQEALSDGLRRSQLFELIADRLLVVIPLLAIGLALLVGAFPSGSLANSPGGSPDPSATWWVGPRSSDGKSPFPRRVLPTPAG